MYKNLSLTVITAVMLFSGGSTWAAGLANETPCDDQSLSPVCADKVDPTKSVIDVPTDGIIYSTHLCGTSPSPIVLPTSANDDVYAVASFEIIGEIADEVYVRAYLENAKFSGTADKPILIYQDNNPVPPGPGVIGNGKVNITKPGNGAIGTPEKCDSNWCRWIVRPQTNKKLQHGDKMYIYYQLTSLVDCDVDGTQVKMTMKLGSQFIEDLMGQDDVVVATFKDPFPTSGNFEPGTDPTIKISSEDEFKLFTSDSTSSTELLGPDQVVIGYLILKRIEDVMAEDGVTEWFLGNTTLGVEGLEAGYDEDDQIETILTITNGQFAASQTGSSGGDVYLQITNPANLNISAEEVTATDATWHLSDGELNQIVGAFEDPNGQKKIPIVIKVDGDTSILNDTGEDALPEATLIIDYKKADSQKDVTYGPGELRRFTADGISCWIYSVPNATAKDQFNLRITNDSTVDGTVRGTLYGLDGSSIFSKQPLLGVDANGDEVELKAGATVRLTADDLANLPGGPYNWNGRGIMNVTSTLSRLEMLVLVREKTGASNANVRPLTNMSVGAHGNSCAN